MPNKRSSKHSSKQSYSDNVEIHYYKEKHQSKLARNSDKETRPFVSPLKKHHCTDIICLVLFILFFAVLVFISIFAYINGKPTELILPHDSKGQVCGKSPGLENKTNLLFFDITRCLVLTSVFTGCPTSQVCVSSCPDENLLYSIPSHQEKMEKFCDPSEKDPKKRCPVYVVASKAVFGRCVPVIITSSNLNQTIEVTDSISKKSTSLNAFNGSLLTGEILKEASGYITNLLNAKNFFETVLEDFTKSYWLIVIGLVLGAAVALIWIFILRFIVKPVVYLTIFVVLGLLGFGTYCAFQEYLDLKSRQIKSGENFKVEYQKLFDLNYVGSLKETWLIMSIVCGVLFLILFFIVVFLRKRISLACELIKEASKAMLSIPASFIWPIIPFLLQIAILAYCITTAVFLASSGVQLFKLVETNLSNASTTENAIFREVFLKAQEESSQSEIKNLKKSTLLSAPMYLQYLNDNKNQYKPGVFCLPKNFNAYKANATANGDLSLETLECNFYAYGFDTTLPVDLNSAELEKYYTKAIEFINKYQWIPQVFVLFMLFWLTAFNVGLNEMTIAGSFGAYYWTRYSHIDKHYKNKLPTFTVLGSFFRAIFYHFGTLAFGSLLIAIVKLIRVILEFIDKKLKAQTGGENKLVKYLMCCCKCCFWCLERFLKFMNRYAFVITAVYSLNFCRAASKAFQLIGANVLRVAVVDNISHFILFLSNLAITGIVGVLGFYFFSGKIPIDWINKYLPELNYYFLPLLVLCLGVFFVSKFFFDVFSMGIDSLLMCVLIDLEENDGSETRPYFMSKNLRKILRK